MIADGSGFVTEEGFAWQGQALPGISCTPPFHKLQYQKVMTNEDITHCLHGTPYEPNCGGFYP